MLRWIYYTYRNLVYYRTQRQVQHNHIMDLASARDPQAMKDALTSGVLATVGLRIVENDKDTVPWYIPLSKLQKSWIRQVTVHGYKVGLT